MLLSKREEDEGREREEGEERDKRGGRGEDTSTHPGTCCSQREREEGEERDRMRRGERMRILALTQAHVALENDFQVSHGRLEIAQ